VVLDLLRKAVGQARKPAHGHPHREVLPFHVTGADMLQIRIAEDRNLFRGNEVCGAIA
jgi:hypothetical protein